MKVAGYARVSTDLQREKETIKTQVELIEQICKQQGHRLTHIYCDDGVSGTTHLHERPEGDRLVKDAMAGKFEGIVVYKADRIGRDVLVNETAVRTLYDGLGIEFVGISEKIDLATPIGRAMFTFQSAIGRLERENTLQRSRDATIRLAKEGVWLGGIVPFGYRVTGIDREARLRVADEVLECCGMSEAEAVVLMYTMSGALGMSCIAIAHKLNELGVPTCYARDGREILRNKRKKRTEAVWRSSRVRNLLVETTYKGIHYWGKRGKGTKKPEEKTIIERAVPAIVGEELWQQAQDTLKRNQLPGNSTNHLSHRKYLLRGFAKCAHCGLTYTGTAHAGRKVEDVPTKELEGQVVRAGRILRRYYSCNGRNPRHQVYGRGDGVCKSRAVSANELERKLWAQVEAMLQEPTTVLEQLKGQLRARYAGSEKLTPVLEKLRGEIAEKDAERATLYRLLRRGAISEADLDLQIAEVLSEETELKVELERIEKELGDAMLAERALADAGKLIERLRVMVEGDRERDGEVSWDTKRSILETIVAKIEIETRIVDNLNVPKIVVQYRFEEKKADGRVRHQTTIDSGLGIDREICMDDGKETPQERNLRVVGELLKAKPLATLDELIGLVEAENGVRLSRASMSRLRQKASVPIYGTPADVENAPHYLLVSR